MHLLVRHKLPFLRSSEPAEMGRHLSRYLAPTIVKPLGGVVRPARVSGIQIGVFSIAVVALGTAAAIEATGQGDYAVMIVCLEGSGEVADNGHVVALRANQGYFACPRGVMRARFSRDCVRLVIRIESSLLGRHLLRNGVHFDITNPALGPWFDYIQFLLSSQASIEAIVKHHGIREHTEALMVALLVNTVLPAIQDIDRPPDARSEVRRAELFIREHLFQNVSLEEIAEATGVSVRTLQTSFKRHHKVSPMRYLRDLRLDVARERILAGTSVAAAAFECGIAHPGRFAQYYRSRFGHLPSTTGQGPERSS
ncbi:AraC family transcriptional regulator [Burkholderia guangdongensis]|uniref:AraC family transcriptional regulator n=1 Tax=Burkholderia guangdongensis TaxID=1792500 RepID=UPI0015C767A9|nr:AraC family transcriptional regulator [Burkholderia guangdongensis]